MQEWIQFINGGKLKEKAYRQQTSSKIISPERGSILDVNGKSLAISENVDTISVKPSKISNEKKSLIARAFADIFELDYDETLESGEVVTVSNTDYLQQLIDFTLERVGDYKEVKEELQHIVGEGGTLDETT